jgi:NADPH-dependent curcumin reductase CurA
MRGWMNARRPYVPLVDAFFDTVGGDILNQGLTRLARRARVVSCDAMTSSSRPFRGVCSNHV